ncbi:hypothetical protein L210DRAFT_861759, partial [Boletus edulis BED1]
KKEHAQDLLTIFSDICKVKFCHVNGHLEALKGRWCNVCKDDEKCIQKHGKPKSFQVGSNLSCRQHIRGHYDVDQERCAAQNVKENHHAIPCDVLRAQNEAMKQRKEGQRTLDGASRRHPNPGNFQETRS